MKVIVWAMLIMTSCSKATILKVSKGFRGLYCKGEEKVLDEEGYSEFELIITEEKLLESVILERQAKKYKFWFEIQSTPESTERRPSGIDTIIWKYNYKTVIRDIKSGEVVLHDSGSGLSKEEGSWHDALGEKLYKIKDDEVLIHCYRY